MRMRRVAGNVVRVYALAALMTLLVVSAAHAVSPSGPTAGIIGYTVYTVGILLVGLPGVCVAFYLIDLWLEGVRRARAVMTTIALLPAVGYGLYALKEGFSPVVVGTLIWLALVGLAVGAWTHMPSTTRTRGCQWPRESTHLWP